MLPSVLIYGCIVLGLIATVVVIAADAQQLRGMINVVNGNDEISKFRRVYLPAFLIAMLADWLQGPFVYALYEGYGIDREHNGYLFVAGFGASAVVGTFVGAAADQYGRKKFAMLYCVIYFFHCITKHWSYFGVLTFGRIMGGISTSLLFSVFDSWMVSESQRQGLGEHIGDTFSIAYFGSSIAAIFAGFLGNAAAAVKPLTELGGGLHYGGYISPFDLSNVFLCLCFAFVFSNWSENYGQSSSEGTNFGKALGVVVNNPQVFLCGLAASSFESSMFIFVFNWTPCLMEGDGAPPFGHIFSCFMIMCMLGSRVYSYLSQVMTVEKIGIITMIASACCHAVIVVSSNVSLRFLAFLVFEACVGMYFPLMGSLKGDIVPESMRSTIYNIYRFPLNGIVLLPLLFNFGITTTFIVTTFFLILASACQFYLMKLRQQTSVNAKNQEEMNAIVIGEADDDDEWQP